MCAGPAIDKRSASLVGSRTGTCVTHYEVHDLLGRGGMGEIYRATDLKLGRQVALKFLHPMADDSLRSRLTNEARIASQIDHPNICTIFEVDETAAGEVFIAMAFYDGEPLDRVLSKGQLPVGRAMDFAIQTGRGLAAAHEQLLVHQDIKPGNLMITRDDTVKILDFGIAGAIGESPPDSKIVLGTPAYISPEKIRGEVVDFRSDIWSLGVVLYEMLAGSAPFGTEPVEAVITSILNESPPPLKEIRPNIPMFVDKIIDRALAKDYRQRYDHTEDLVRDLVMLQRALDSGAITQRLTTTRERPSVAVLPFDDMTAAKDQGFLCDGIAEEILRALGRIPELRVASRTSAFQFKRSTSDIREIGAKLNVNTVLEGSVRRVGNRVRISAQLINVHDGYRLWSGRFERQMKDIFEIEDEIADQIALALEITLEERIRPITTGPSLTDARAHEHFLLGRQFMHQHRRKAFEIALRLFTQAIELDPEYGRAYAGIADCHAFLRMYFGTGDSSVTAADIASSKALELRPDLPDSHASRGFALFLQEKFEDAESHLRKAIDLDPHLYEPHYISGRLNFSRGKVLEASMNFKEACDLVPEAFDSWYLLGMCYRRLGETKRARNANLECMEAAKARVRSHPDDTRAWTMGASVLVELGEPEKAEKWVQTALAVDSEEPIIEYNAACVYTALGKNDEAIECLKKARENGSLSHGWSMNDPDLEPLHSDPRFQALFMDHTGS